MSSWMVPAGLAGIITFFCFIVEARDEGFKGMFVALLGLGGSALLVIGLLFMAVGL